VRFSTKKSAERGFYTNIQFCGAPLRRDFEGQAGFLHTCLFKKDGSVCRLRKNSLFYVILFSQTCQLELNGVKLGQRRTDWSNRFWVG
jgi:hypothetical protein